ncbi:MAG: hypothetical protein ACYTG5_05430 [Planctomycetota bacterium]|jgi:hypothetical protein
MTFLPRTLACALVLSGPVYAQVGENSSAVQAWLIELLDRDTERAREIYELLGQDETRSIEDQRISRGRLNELRLGSFPMGDLYASLREITWVQPQGQGRRPWINLRDEFQRLLNLPEGPEREARLEEIRGILSDPALEPGIRTRPSMEATIRELRQQQSSAMAKLEADIARARAENDPDRRRQLRRELDRMRRPALTGERWGQINRRPLAVIVQRHLQGRTETAESMTRSLTRRWGRGQSSLREVELPEDADHRKLLTEARSRLEDFIRDEDLSAFEREVMNGLSRRLEELQARGQDSVATQLLAKLPYYGSRFLR